MNNKNNCAAYLIIMQSACSSWSTLSKYIISRSDTIAPFITIISSPLMIPENIVGNEKCELHCVV